MKSRSHKFILVIFISFLSLTISLVDFLSGQELPVKYSKVRVYINTPQDIITINRAGLVFDHIIFHGNSFDVVLNNWELNHLKKIWTAYDILVEDMEAEYRSRPKLSQAELADLEARMKQKYGFQGFGFGSMGGYYTFDEIVQDLDEMVTLYPNLITPKQSIGKSIEGRDIWMVKISDNPNIKENEEEILYTALMHAREPQGMASVMYYMWYLLENYGTDSVVTFLVDNRELYFIPCINPDGYVYNEMTNPNGGGMWRKNRRNNGNGIFGVDINRNFDYQWGFNNSGSSPNPSSSTYRGTAPASEPETQAIQNFAISHNFTMVFNYHSVAGTFNFPWGYLPNFFTPDHAQFVAFSQQMQIFNNFPYGTPSQTLGYVVNGYSNDWFYGEQTLKNKAFSWTVECSGSGFWPPQNQIIPLAIQTMHSNFVLANGISGGMPPVVDITATPQNPPVIIPPSGGFFDFDVTLTNNTNMDWTVDYWNTVTIPSGEEIGPQLGPFTVTVTAGGTFTTTLTMEVPSKPPPATYVFNMKVGNFSGGGVLDTDSFNIIKTSGPGATKAGVSFSSNDWESNINNQISVPQVFVLEQNYPNPFNPSTTISYQIPRAGYVSLIIYDLNGRKIEELVNKYQNAGSYTVQWDGKDLSGRPVASGIYIYKISAGKFKQTRKMILVK
ncbi:MAG: T9SS C-terminal target domain-containing protein [Calditrichaeota bacterium]|nr:MAG: T9SS C-terminal target domain-containing protein [Calditrichota bacterium]